MQKVTTLILPIAGLGKRLMPLTAHTPKNLIPVNGKPLLEYVLDEAAASNIKDVILVVNPKNKKDFAAYIAKNKKRFPPLHFEVRVQETPGGNGHAIVQAYDIAKDKPFAVRFCDDVLVGEPSALQSLISIYDQHGASVVLLEKVPRTKVSRFGVIGFEKSQNEAPFAGGKVYAVNKIVEKPKTSEAPSNLTIVGGYVLTPTVMRDLKAVSDTLPTVADDALPLAVALQIELITKGKIFGWEFPGRRLDCGTLEKLRESEAFLREQKQ